MTADPKHGKKHLGIVIVGHVDAGKSTTTGRLLFELGGMSERELDKLRKEAQELGKDSFLFAFFLDRSKEERARGVTISAPPENSLLLHGIILLLMLQDTEILSKT